jgi:hypothetical protein
MAKIDPKNTDTSTKKSVRAKALNVESRRNAYLQTIYDPVNVRGVGIPDDFSMNSQKLRVNSRFTGVCGGAVDNACGFVAVNPHFLVVNNSDAIYTTTSAYTGLVVTNTGTGVVTQNSNSLYLVSDFRRSSTNSLSTTNLTAGRRFRLVSCRVRVESMASTVANFGEMVGLVTPTHESVVGMTFEALNTFPEAARITAKQGNAIELFYTPVWKAESEYHNFVDSNAASVTKDGCRFLLDPAAIQSLTAATYAQYAPNSVGVSNECNAYQPFMVVCFSGSEEIPFRVEIDANFEVIGLNVGQLATPSPYAPKALEEAKKVMSVAPTTVAGEGRSLGQAVLAQVPKLARFAEEQIMRMLPAPIESGYELMKNLLF